MTLSSAFSLCWLDSQVGGPSSIRFITSHASSQAAPLFYEPQKKFWGSSNWSNSDHMSTSEPKLVAREILAVQTLETEGSVSPGQTMWLGGSPKRN